MLSYLSCHHLLPVMQDRSRVRERFHLQRRRRVHRILEGREKRLERKHELEILKVQYLQTPTQLKLVTSQKRQEGEWRGKERERVEVF